MYFRTLAREQGRPRGTQTSLVIGITMFAIKLLFNQLKSEERLTISINIIFQSQGIDFGCSKQIIRKQLSEILLSCLVFNHPRTEGWSLNGQVYFTSFCLPSSSTGLQTAFQSILPCCPSIHRIGFSYFLLAV